MKKNFMKWMLGVAVVGSMLASCKPEEPTGSECITKQIERIPWYDEHPEKEGASFSVKTDPVRLHFYGWGLDEDSLITVKFPENTSKYRRAILTYRMGGWNKGPAAWDMTTMIMIKNKQDDKYYELVRAFTPYGGNFDINWEKKYYMDITEYLPMLTGDTELRIYYGGWDATDTTAHTATLTFDFYEGAAENQPVYYAKLYDSRASSNTGYRSWAYGVDTASIEDDARLGIRHIEVPENVKSLLMKVSISGHGHDQGTFLDRPGYQTKNAAEFDRNYYDVIINGEKKGYGEIFYSNANTYPQAGTYKYDRANWGPGLPLNVQYWTINNLPKDGKISIDFNLDRFKSSKNDVKAEGVAQYIIEVDVFGLTH